MEVLKKGPGWSLKKKCSCGSLLKVEKSDLFHTHSHHYDGSHEVYTTFKCPVCGELNDIKDHISFPIPDSYQEWKEKNGPGTED